LQRSVNKTLSLIIMSDSGFKRLVQSVKKTVIADLKHKIREEKLRYVKINKLKALPRINTVYVNANYINPVTLSKVPTGLTVYEVKDPRTGRVDYYDKATFWNLVRRKSKTVKNNFNLLTKRKNVVLSNPVTRSNVRAKNVKRVQVKYRSSPASAAKKIQKAVRKHISKKRKRETGRAGSQRVSK